ncbi:MAG: methyltransferase [Plectolyngbya sp. WJT66-NPBG17]|jgi:hypothetical protein|nr:methyltransferase [Plectolyngbya sp. WJT66-NPBG17]
MIASPTLKRRTSENLPSVEADIYYLVPMADKPIIYTYEPPPGVPQYNGTYIAHRLPIYNARSLTPNLSLDREGFTFAAHSTKVQDFYNEDEVCQVYYAEAEQLLKAVTGAIKVIVFDHNLRNADRAKQGDRNIKEPVQRAHNDFTAKSGYGRAQIVLSQNPEAEELLQHRFGIVNVWRPISTVQKSPIAVCDAQSIALTDWVASDLLYRDRVGETYGITHNQNHQWFYFPQQQRDEALLIKCFDSSEDGQARFAAHSAFDDSTSSPDAPARESIELRTLVFYE